MDIKRVGRKPSSPLKQKEKETQSRVNLKHSIFFDTLQEYGRDKGTENWEELLTAVDEAAKRLLKQRNIANLRRYRELVREFMRKAVAGSYNVKGARRWDGRGNRKAYYLIEKVNSSLEELAAMVLKKQENTLKLMATLDEIRGLLLDFYY